MIPSIQVIVLCCVNMPPFQVIHGLGRKRKRKTDENTQRTYSWDILLCILWHLSVVNQITTVCQRRSCEKLLTTASIMTHFCSQVNKKYANKKERKMDSPLTQYLYCKMGFHLVLGVSWTYRHQGPQPVNLDIDTGSSAPIFGFAYHATNIQSQDQKASSPASDQGKTASRRTMDLLRKRLRFSRDDRSTCQRST